jgi:LysM repeat protein
MTDEKEDEEYEDEEASSESEDQYEDEDAEASDESGEAGDESEDSVASWGYEDKKPRFSKEVIAGFLAICMLLTIFCVMVYKSLPGDDDDGDEGLAQTPPTSLNTPEGDANDPFGPGAAPGSQSAPGEGGPDAGGGTPGDPLASGDPDGTLRTGSTLSGFDPNGDGTGSSLPFPEVPGSGQPGTEDPFASNSETADLFPSQQEPTLDSGSDPALASLPATDEFGRPISNGALGSTATGSSGSLTDPAAGGRRNVFGGPSSSEFAATGSPDPFTQPDLSGSTAGDINNSLDSNSSSGSPGFENAFDNPRLADGSGSEDPFPTGDQLVQNEPDLGGSGVSGNTRRDPFGGPSTSLNSEPFGTPTTGSPSNEPFEPESGIADTRPRGLLDRGPETSLNDGGPNDPSATGLSSGPAFDSNTGTGSEFGPADGNPPGSSSSLETVASGSSTYPLRNDDPFGTSGPDSSDDSFSTPVSESPSLSNEPFGTSTAASPSDPFPNPAAGSNPGFEPESSPGSGTSEPVNLFPGSSSGRPAIGTASSEPFQPSVTSTPGSGFSTGSTETNSGGPFGSQPFTAGSSATASTFAGNANSGSYTVQAGDSYWNISKKVYGTAKYFQVLADHNRGTIADPQKIKAGAVVQTPPASVLQGRLKTVRRATPAGLAGRIESSGRADHAGSAGSIGSASSSAASSVVSRRPASRAEPTGIWFNQQGYPMFRIGETDTLTSIASDHLGRASRWQQVFNMNRDQLQSPDKLQIGMHLKLPADASRVPLVDRTSSLR